jgi:outer membrane protein TolC
MKTHCGAFCFLLVLVLAAVCERRAPGQQRPEPPAAEPPDASLPSPRKADVTSNGFPLPPDILTPDVKPIDLASSLRLAGVENPEILLARQRVVEAVALRQLAAVQILPNINVGTNYDAHVGTLQQSNGNILKVNRDALYVGLGADAVAAGTVAIPGIVWSGNLSDVIFANLVSRQRVRQAEANSFAVRNDILLQVSTAYVELLRAEGRLAVALRNREENREVARITAAYAQTGQGRKADADRAATELARRDEEILDAQGQVLTASANLARLLNLDPSVRLHAADGWVVPASIVPDPIPLAQLIAIALDQRPELAAQRAAIREAFLALQAAKLLPFSPNALVGYSTGAFGGGSNLVAQPGGFGGFQEPRFDSFADRQDFDVVLYWTLQNLGVGNIALVRAARSRLRSSNLQELIVLDRVRTEVATAYARVHARFAQINTSERAVRSGASAFQEDLLRTRGNQGLPIEVLDSLRLLANARYDYLDAISDYNRAQFELYVALGQPPANYLARPIPADLIPPSTPSEAGGRPAQSPPAMPPPVRQQ